MKCLYYQVEHRFYGKSQPFEYWSVENLKYLKADQALADLNNFVTAMNAALIRNTVLEIGNG